MSAPINAEEPPKGVSPTIWKKALDAALSLLSKGRNYAMQKGEFTPQHKRAYGFSRNGYALNINGNEIFPRWNAHEYSRTDPPLFSKEYIQFDPVTKRPVVNPVPPPSLYGKKQGGKKSRHTKKRSSRQ